MSGYVRIHRTLFGHPAFRNESEAMAFAWLIGKAAWKPTRVRYKGHPISLKRGQLAISLRDMAAAFDRDKAWISRLLNRLISETMVETHAETGVTVITICNYDEYQGDEKERETPRETQGETRRETEVRQRRDTEQEREESKNKAKASTRELSLPTDLQRVMDEADLVSPPDRRILQGWYDLGATLEQDILPVIRKVLAREKERGAPRPTSLKYFDGPLKEKLAQDERELEASQRNIRRWERIAAEEAAERQAATGGA